MVPGKTNFLSTKLESKLVALESLQDVSISCPNISLKSNEPRPTKTKSHHRRRRRYKLRRQQQEISLGLTLVAISILFIVCQSVKLVPDLYEALFCSSQSGHDVPCHGTKLIDGLISLANLFACINSAANFLIYMLRGKKFREEFVSTYSTCHPSSASLPLSASTKSRSTFRMTFRPSSRNE